MCASPPTVYLHLLGALTHTALRTHSHLHVPGRPRVRYTMHALWKLIIDCPRCPSSPGASLAELSPLRRAVLPPRGPSRSLFLSLFAHPSLGALPAALVRPASASRTRRLTSQAYPPPGKPSPQPALPIVRSYGSPCVSRRLRSRAPASHRARLPRRKSERVRTHAPIHRVPYTSTHTRACGRAHRGSPISGWSSYPAPAPRISSPSFCFWASGQSAACVLMPVLRPASGLLGWCSLCP